MRKILVLFASTLFFATFQQSKAQKLLTNTSVTGVCYAGNKVNRIYIPPPDKFYKKGGSKGGGSVTIYYSGFSPAAIIPMEYAATILESILPADTKLTIRANYLRISDAGVLGNSTITGYMRGSDINALNPFAFYPVALAEKIAGKSLNDSLYGDIELNINNSISWYLGIDGNTPTVKFDLVTVVLHEICHGLGFFDSMNTDGYYGWYGIRSVPPDNDTLPMIYDTFIENSQGKKLTDKNNFVNVSTELLYQYTSRQLYFKGPLLDYYNLLNYPALGSRAMLYAPAIWDSGSSISHLDDVNTLEPNTLMTPFIDKGEAIHDPGGLTMSILGDMGWINTRIIHNKPHDSEEHLQKIELSAKIESDTLFNRNMVGVVFSFDKFDSSDTIFMASPLSDDFYTTSIDIPGYNSELQYYFFVRDVFARLYRSPSLYDKKPYTILVGTDIVKPVIKHIPVDYILETIDTISFIAEVSDNLGVDSVYLEYKLNDGTSELLKLKPGTSDIFSNVLVVKSGLLAGIDSLQYRIIAVDSAKVPNTAFFPESGYFVIDIEKILTPVQGYATNFSGAADDFFNIGFDIIRPEGFSSFGLHTKHPYESPEDPVDVNRSIDYTAMLRHPVIFNESGMLFTYKEIVLVEPGETGSVFGSDDFYDYVVVEGSKDFGKTWFSLFDGYDSRILSSWLSSYNNSIVGQNSTFVGTEGMLQKHDNFIGTSEKISAGDTLLLRFRLHSDPFANGWGWVIEDLKINPLIDAVEKKYNDHVRIYPNPGKGLITIDIGQTPQNGGKPTRYSIFNSTGTQVISNKFIFSSVETIDISSYPSGIYIIILYSDEGVKTIKYSLIK